MNSEKLVREKEMLTLEGIRAAGFDPITNDTKIAARFHRIEVFRVSGFTLDDTVLMRHSHHLRGLTFDVALSNSVNRICRSLLADDFVADEDKWREEKNVSPPYLVVHFGPTDLIEASSGHQGRFDGHLVTYETFSNVRSQMREQSERLIPQLIAALTAHFAQFPENIKFDPIQANTIGLTTSGESLTDVSLHANASISVSRHRREPEIAAILQGALAQADRITHKAAEYFYLACKEADSLKRFLFLFLALEVHTHKSFKRIEHQKQIDAMTFLPERVKVATRTLFSSVASGTTLKERFVWCAMSVWTGLTDSDVEDFSELKGLRDDIAHGRKNVVTGEEVRKAHNLVSKVLAS